jgi:hypothetical protein
MGNAAVLDMKGESRTPKLKKPRERIECLEERPKPEWFVRCKARDGKVLWFLRVSVTGLRVRRYGPFASKHQCLLFLDRWHGSVDVISELANIQDSYAIPERRFENRGGHYPLIESELTLHAPTVRRKGGGFKA